MAPEGAPDFAVTTSAISPSDHICRCAGRSPGRGLGSIFCMSIGQLIGRLARRTVAFNRSKLDLGAGVRCGIGVAIPLVIGLAIGHPSGGAYAAAGALLTPFAASCRVHGIERRSCSGWPHRSRSTR